jgi:hypothetical protein
MGIEEIGFAVVKGGNLEHLCSSLSDLQKENNDYSRTLNYLIALAERLNSHGLADKYSLIGGYAVFAHIFSVLGRQMLNRWRGSIDIDILSIDPSVKSAVEGAFQTVSVERSHFEDKYTLGVKDELELIKGELEEIDPSIAPIKIDFYIPSDGKGIRIYTEKMSQEAIDNSE